MEEHRSAANQASRILENEKEKNEANAEINELKKEKDKAEKYEEPVKSLEVELEEAKKTIELLNMSLKTANKAIANLKNEKEDENAQINELKKEKEDNDVKLKVILEDLWKYDKRRLGSIKKKMEKGPKTTEAVLRSLRKKNFEGGIELEVLRRVDKEFRRRQQMVSMSQDEKEDASSDCNEAKRMK